jgi:hypothetical protein
MGAPRFKRAALDGAMSSRKLTFPPPAWLAPRQRCDEPRLFAPSSSRGSLKYYI